MANLTRCPNSHGYYRLVFDEDLDLGLPESDRTFLTRCGSWLCPYCATVNAIKLRHQLRKACLSLWKSVEQKGFRIEYYFKLLTLTLPGRRYRDYYSPEQGEADLKKNFRKLLDALRKRYGWFDYCWVMEPQSSGYPHLHVLLVGRSIIPGSIFRYIKSLWEKKYGMGYADIRKGQEKERGGLNRVVNYLTKYISKSLIALRATKRGNRVFGMSKAFRAAKNAKRRSYRVIEFGKVEYDPITETEKLVPMWSAQDETDMEVFLHTAEVDAVPESVLDELCEFFDQKARGLPVYEQVLLRFAEPGFIAAKRADASAPAKTGEAVASGAGWSCFTSIVMNNLEIN